MNAPKYKIGDHVRRTDITENKIHTIEAVREHLGGWIYSMVGQGWADGWAWAEEWCIGVCENDSKMQQL